MLEEDSRNAIEMEDDVDAGPTGDLAVVLNVQTVEDWPNAGVGNTGNWGRIYTLGDMHDSEPFEASDASGAFEASGSPETFEAYEAPQAVAGPSEPSLPEDMHTTTVEHAGHSEPTSLPLLHHCSRQRH